MSVIDEHTPCSVAGPNCESPPGPGWATKRPVVCHHCQEPVCVRCSRRPYVSLATGRERKRMCPPCLRLYGHDDLANLITPEEP